MFVCSFVHAGILTCFQDGDRAADKPCDSHCICCNPYFKKDHDNVLTIRNRSSLNRDLICILLSALTFVSVCVCVQGESGEAPG